MSMIQVTGTTRTTANSVLVQLDSGKRSMYVTVWADGHLWCLVNNRVARRAGYGKTYANLDAALAAYKSADVHAMIRTALEVAANA